MKIRGLMKKKIILFTLLVLISLLTVIFFFKKELFAPKQMHSLGVHGALVSKKDMSSKVLYQYCIENKLESSKIEIYEASYSVFNTGIEMESTPLPILNPNSVKNILGIYSSIPLKENKNKIGQAYNLEIDPAWLKNKPKGLLEEPLVIRYAFQRDDVNTLPEGISVSKLSSKALIKEIHQNPKLKLTFTLAEKIKSELPLASQDDLKTLVKAYALWIDQNIAYPAEDLYPLTYKYINLKAPDQTLKYRVGVCEDNAYLLKALLNSQGIKSYITIGKMPTSYTFETLLPKNYTMHAVVAISTLDGYFIVDPTTQSITKPRLLTLNDGKVLKVSSPLKESYLESFPMYIESIEDSEMYNRGNCDYIYRLKKLKYFTH